MSNKEKLVKCLGWLAVAFTEYVSLFGLPYGFRVDQDFGVITIQMNDYWHVRKVGKCFDVDYILSLKDPIECLRMELINMHKELSGGEHDGL